MAAQSLSRQKITYTQKLAQTVFYLRLANKRSKASMGCNPFLTEMTTESKINSLLYLGFCCMLAEELSIA